MTELPRRETIGDLKTESPEARTVANEITVGAQAVAGTLAATILLLSSTIALSVFTGITTGISPYWWSVGVVFVLACGVLTPTAVRLSKERLSGLPAPRGAHRLHQRAKKPRLSPSKRSLDEDRAAERQLLEAIERHGEVTPPRAALETSLTVAEADRMLGELAEKGHLEVHAREGKLVYSF